MQKGLLRHLQQSLSHYLDSSSLSLTSEEPVA